MKQYTFLQKSSSSSPKTANSSMLSEISAPDGIKEKTVRHNRTATRTLFYLTDTAGGFNNIAVRICKTEEGFATFLMPLRPVSEQTVFCSITFT